MELAKTQLAFDPGVAELDDPAAASILLLRLGCRPSCGGRRSWPRSLLCAAGHAHDADCPDSIAASADSSDNPGPRLRSEKPGFPTCVCAVRRSAGACLPGKPGGDEDL